MSNTATALAPPTAEPVRPAHLSDIADDTAPPLRIVIVGHVDHGKSTMVGRLFHDTGSLPQGKKEAIELSCKKRGVPFEWAFLMDAFKSERDQNITIDTAQIWFKTEKRRYVIIDAPGHKEFLKNMVTGAAQADAALLLIAADEGVQEQSRRHGFLLSMLGVKQVHVVVNKIDRINYDRKTYEAIVEEYTAYLKSIGVTPKGFIPISARDGDNITAPSANTVWYDGRPLTSVLDAFDAPAPPHDAPLRYVIQDLYRFDHRRILAGRIEAGTLNVGDELMFLPGGKTSRVKTIETWSAPEKRDARAGESIGITLEEQIFVERGHVAVKVGEQKQAPVHVSERFSARLFWLGKNPLSKSRTVKLKLGTAEADARIEKIDRIIDASTLEQKVGSQDVIEKNDVADVTFHLQEPIAFESAEQGVAVGRFVVVDDYDLAGGGLIDGPVQQAVDEAVQQRPVSATERAQLNGHAGAIIWLTGPGPRVAFMRALERQLFAHDIRTGVVDGGALEQGDERTVLLLAQSLCSAGLVVIAAPEKEALPRYAGVPRFYDVRVGTGTSHTVRPGSIDVDIAEGGISAAAKRVAQDMVSRVRDTDQEWFYAI